MNEKNWHDNIPTGGVLCYAPRGMITNIILVTSDGRAWNGNSNWFNADVLTPLTAAELWDFMPWQDMKDAPRDGSEFMALTKGKVCTVFFDVEDDSFITDFNDNGNFYRVFDFKWLSLPQVSK